MPSNRCVVFGCDTTHDDKNTIRHRFPKDQAICDVWIKKSCNNNLLNKSTEQIFKSYVMCDKHFEANCKSSGFKKLIKGSIPTLNLPVSSDLAEQLQSEESRKIASPAFPSSIAASSSTGTSKRSLPPKQLFGIRKNVKGLLKDINMKRRSELTPRKVLLYNAVQIYKHKNLVMQKRYSDAKSRIKMAVKFMNTNTKSIGGLNQFTQNFIESQIWMQPQKPRGRRFTVDDKVFALSLFKQSGKAYRTLSKVFALPSRKSIMDLLKKIPFETGINNRIFEHLKTAVKKLKNKLDRYCTVIFDEVSISASLQFNESSGKIIGFEDLGRSNRSLKLADKALVFMVRGIRKKFKQPVAFYLTNSNMNSLNLSIIIKEVIEAVQSTGLTVISTVCDQAPSNVAAINRLIKIT